jgi:hypothetical protein
MASQVVRFTDAYQDLRFGGRHQSAPVMVRLLEELERSRARGVEKETGVAGTTL